MNSINSEVRELLYVIMLFATIYLLSFIICFPFEKRHYNKTKNQRQDSNDTIEEMKKIAKILYENNSISSASIKSYRASMFIENNETTVIISTDKTQVIFRGGKFSVNNKNLTLIQSVMLKAAILFTITVCIISLFALL